MIRWCAYCVRFMGEGPPHDDFSLTHGICSACRKVYASQAVKEYVVAIVRATRATPDLRLGASPRAALHLVQAAKASAAMEGREHVLPDDVKALFIPVCAHRVVSKTYLHNGDANATARVLQAIMDQVAAPK